MLMNTSKANLFWRSLLLCYVDSQRFQIDPQDPYEPRLRSTGYDKRVNEKTVKEEAYGKGSGKWTIHSENKKKTCVKIEGKSKFKNIRIIKIEIKELN